MISATEGAVEGPFYRPDAPLLEEPYTLVRRQGERGAVLVFSGEVFSAEGGPLAGALVDLWHAGAEGLYSPGVPTDGDFGGLFDQRQPPFNLRGRLHTGPHGNFEVRTVVPGAYREPPGSTDELSMRPAHLHAKVSHPGYAALTTQLFFEEDPHLSTDPAGAVRPGLVTKLERRSDPDDLAARCLLRPYFACGFRFVLRAGTPAVTGDVRG